MGEGRGADTTWLEVSKTGWPRKILTAIDCNIGSSSSSRSVSGRILLSLKVAGAIEEDAKRFRPDAIAHTRQRHHAAKEC